MLTIITGTPGAGKSLYSVWEEARKVPGSTVEAGERCVSHGVEYAAGDAVPRHLFSNVKGLLIDHTHITADDLNTWHEWAQPGDVILFDEVQEVWRPRGMGSKVPECIAALEVHRHKGVDLILVTQHPLLVDPNIRRLCNRHLHLRRITKKTAYVYEWDHCSDPKAVRTAMQGKLWFHPRRGYALYKSAQLHTKPTARLPRVALVGLLAVGGAAYLAPTAIARITERFQSQPKGHAFKEAKPEPVAARGGLPPAQGPAQAFASVGASSAPARRRVLGCIVLGPRCECFAEDGEREEVQLGVCEVGTRQVGYVLPSKADAKPPHTGDKHGGPEAPNRRGPQGRGRGDGAAGPMSTEERSGPVVVRQVNGESSLAEAVRPIEANGTPSVDTMRKQSN